MSQTLDLSFFYLLANKGSLAATARELGVTPPAVSKRLTALEARLGIRLVNRTTRSMSLTSEGELYFSHAARILTQIDEVEQLISSSRATPKGLIRVNASLGFGRRYIGPALGAFFAQYPEVEIQLEISDHPLDLATHGFDLGIRFGTLPDAAFHARKIASNRRLLCACRCTWKSMACRNAWRIYSNTTASSCDKTKRPMAYGVLPTVDARRTSKCAER